MSATLIRATVRGRLQADNSSLMRGEDSLPIWGAIERVKKLRSRKAIYALALGVQLVEKEMADRCQRLEHQLRRANTRISSLEGRVDIGTRVDMRERKRVAFRQTNTEQYDVLDESGLTIGHLTREHGTFTVRMGGPEGEVIYQAKDPKTGDFLKWARKAIMQRLSDREMVRSIERALVATAGDQ